MADLPGWCTQLYGVQLCCSAMQQRVRPGGSSHCVSRHATIWASVCTLHIKIAKHRMYGSLGRARSLTVASRLCCLCVYLSALYRQHTCSANSSHAKIRSSLRQRHRQQHLCNCYVGALCTSLRHSTRFLDLPMSWC